MKSSSMAEKKEGRLARHLRVVKQIRNEPKSIGPLLRGWFLGLWKARGGGFYGLGYAVTFVVLEVRTLAGEVDSSASVSEFVSQQALAYLLRISVESFLNAFLALLWPALTLQWLGAWGIAVLIGGYVGFERGLRPLVERQFPELQKAPQRKQRSS